MMGWLLALWLLWAGLLGGGFVWGRPTAAKPQRMPLWTRIGSSMVLVIIAITLAATGRETAYLWLITLGMGLGLVGDLFMARLLPLRKAEMGGMAAFGLGHIVYLVALIGFNPVENLAGRPLFWLGWLAWLLLGGVGWYLIVWRGQTAGLLPKLALPYALLLASTAGAGTGAGLVDGRFLPFALGGALFLFSDLLIALRLFRHNQNPWLNDLIWLTYGPAQALIIFTGALL